MALRKTMPIAELRDLNQQSKQTAPPPPTPPRPAPGN